MIHHRQLAASILLPALALACPQSPPAQADAKPQNPPAQTDAQPQSPPEQTVAQPQSPPAQAVAQPKSPAAQAVADKIPWFSGTLDMALAEGRSKGKLVLAFFRADEDTGCTSMSQVTFSDDRVVAALSKLVCVRVDYKTRTSLESQVPIQHLPVFVWYNPDGTPRDRTDGLYDGDSFLGETARIVNDLGTINDLRRKLVGREKDADAHFELFLRLRAAGDVQGANEEKATIQSLDPGGVSRASMRFRYEEITTAIEQYWAEKRALPMDKVAELRAFVELQDDPDIVWDGWMRLANTHQYLERLAAGKFDEAKAHRATRRECLARAWRGIPQTQTFLRQWSLESCELFWNQRGELSDADKSFFLAMTMRMVQMFDTDPEVLACRARALKLNGNLEDARAAARKAAEVSQNDPKYQQLVKEIQAP